jgi:hypothetical protein
MDTKRAVKALSLFYFQKALNQITGQVKNAFRLWGGSLVKMRTEDLGSKLLKQKLLCSYLVFLTVGFMVDEFMYTVLRAVEESIAWSYAKPLHVLIYCCMEECQDAI